MTKNRNLQPRPPIVVVMGHVDHGKTTLLDYIRKTTVAAWEVGGITQSIGAYEIIHNGKKITFIDTPGHEAFSKMRTRGANVADLAILVVAADEGVKPQTKETIEILDESKTPFVVAINKIDKSNADIEKTKQELMQANVLLEGFGGNISWQAISAKTGEGVNGLLDLILLAAEMENLTYQPDVPASGVIIESKISSRKGIIAVAIVKNGVLKIDDQIATLSARGRVKSLMNFLREPVQELAPSSPAIILGFKNLPQTGEDFFVGGLEIIETDKTKEISIPKIIPSLAPKEKEGLPILKIILKADVSGSLEALSGVVRTLASDEVGIEIFSEGVGEIIDGDVKLAQSANALIVGFKTKIAKTAENLAREQNIKIITSEIIYELIKKIEEERENLRVPKPLGEIEILSIFSQKGKKQIIGGKVISGAIKNKMRVRILRGENEMGLGRIINLQKQKQDAVEVSEGDECGILLESDIVIQNGDHLKAYASSN